MPLAWLAVMELGRRFSALWLALLAAALALSFLSGFAAMALVVYGSVVVLALGLWLSRRAGLPRRRQQAQAKGEQYNR